MTFRMNGWSGWSPLRQEVKPREGTVYVGPKPGDEHYQEGDEYKMSDKPMYEGHDPSSHLIADDDNLTAWPTLFQDDEGVWYEGGYEEAKRKGEVYKFNTREEMIDFARKGNWKK